MAEVEVDDTTVADTRLPASTFASTMRTMVISPTQQSSHCIFLINEREREKGGGVGYFQPHSGSCAATPRTCSYPERDRQSKTEKERKKTDFLLFCSADACVTYLLPDFPATFYFFLRFLYCFHRRIPPSFGMNCFPACIVSMPAWELLCPRGRI